MTKLGSKAHIYDVYYRGRDYIIEEIIAENTCVGLSLLKGFIISSWEIIEEIMKEEEDGRE